MFSVVLDVDNGKNRIRFEISKVCIAMGNGRFLSVRGRIVTEHNATHDKRIRVGAGLKMTQLKKLL